MAGHGGSALLDSLDAFKKKHVSQNKEIIHKNSELMKSNGDLNKRLRDSQTELMQAKGEMLKLRGLNFQLDMTNANLREMLRREQERCRELEGELRSSSRGGNMSTERVELLQQALKNIAEQAKHAHSLVQEACSPPPGAFTCAVLPSSALTDSAALRRRPSVVEDQLFASINDMLIPLAGEDGPPPAVPRAATVQSRRNTLATQPDLSYISEGSTEAEQHALSRPASAQSQVAPSSPVADVVQQRRNRRISGALPTPAQDTPPRSFETFTSSPAPADFPSPEPILPLEIAQPKAASPTPSAATVRERRKLDLAQSPHWPAASSSTNIATEVRRKSVLATRRGETTKPVSTRSTTPTSDPDEPAPIVKPAPRPSSTVTKSRSTPSLAAANVTTKRPAAAATARPRASSIVSNAGESDDATVKVSSIRAPAARPSTARRAAPAPVILADASSPSEDEAPPVVKAKAGPASRALQEVTGRQTNVGKPSVLDEAVEGKKREQRVVEELEAVNEELPSSQSENQDAQGGRRAKKSINYALPSLNAKMRRPEDYVPVIARPAKKRQSTSIAGRPYAASEPAHSDEEAEEEGEQPIGGSQPILRSVPMVRSLAQSRRV